MGIDSCETTINLRYQIWNKLASELKFPQFKQLSVDCGLDGLGPEINMIIAGTQRVSVVINMQ